MAVRRERFQVEDFFKLEHAADQLKFLLNFAVLAPSPYNTQPWLFRVQECVVEVWANEKRQLTLFDPNGRQMLMSLGGAIQNLTVVADFYGWPVKVEYFPEPTKPNFVARLEFEKTHYVASQVDHHPHLFFAVPERRSNRYAYEAKEVPEDFVEKVTSLATKNVKVFVVRENEAKLDLARTAGRAVEAAFSMRPLRKELSAWIRSRIERYHDGVSGRGLGISWPASLFAPFIVRNFTSGSEQRGIIESALRKTPAYIIIATETDDLADWVSVGMACERIALMAQAAKLATSMVSAPIQLDNFYQELQKSLTTVFRPQAFLRLGYPTHVPELTPRLPLKEVLIK